MAPRNFSEDGAVGAASAGETPNGSFGTGMQPSIMNGFMPQNNTSTPGTREVSLGMGGGWGGGGLTPPPESDARASGSGPLGAAHPAANWNLTGRPAAQPSEHSDPYATLTNNATSFAGGGAIDEDPNATDPQGSMMGNQLQQSINRAMGVVGSALSYGRKLHGIGGDDNQDGEAIQTADRMPTQPGDQSESGIPREQPMPGPLPPTSNPFGKRADAMPAVPFSESQRPQPMPGPLPPTSNPFGKRADAGDDEAISTDEEAA